MHNFHPVVDLIGDNSQINHRLHTFGIGKAVSKRLIKTGAIKGLGNYHLSATGKDLSDKMVSIITEPKPCYTVLQSIRIYDQHNNQIHTSLADTVSPLSNGEVVTLADLLSPGENAVKYEVEILD